MEPIFEAYYRQLDRLERIQARLRQLVWVNLAAWAVAAYYQYILLIIGVVSMTTALCVSHWIVHQVRGQAIRQRFDRLKSLSKSNENLIL